MELFLIVFGVSILAIGYLGKKFNKSVRKSQMKRDLEIYDELRKV